jgi:DNA-binding response OmpR family regulator
MASRILVLEDDADVAELVAAALKAAGHSVITASSVPRAITMVRNEDIDLAIVDIMMPIVDGYQFCSWLRNRKKTSETPIIVLTGQEERYGRERAEALKVSRFMTKPFGVDELLSAVSECIRKA